MGSLLLCDRPSVCEAQQGRTAWPFYGFSMPTERRTVLFMEQNETESHLRMRRSRNKYGPFCGLLVYTQVVKEQTGRIQLKPYTVLGVCGGPMGQALTQKSLENKVE